MRWTGIDVSLLKKGGSLALADVSEAGRGHPVSPRRVSADGGGDLPACEGLGGWSLPQGWFSAAGVVQGADSIQWPGGGLGNQ